MRLDDLVDIILVHKLIPDGLWVDHHHRSIKTAPKASRFIDSNLTRLVEFELGYPCFGIVENLAGTVRIAAGVAVIALIAADEYMLFEIAHAVPGVRQNIQVVAQL